MTPESLQSPLTVVRPREPSALRRWLTRSLFAVAVVIFVAAAAFLMAGSGSSQELDDIPLHEIKRGELLVTVTEQGTLESSNNIEIKCKVRGDNTITWVIENGTKVEPGDELLTLDTLLIEEEISERLKFFHLASSEAARAKADVARAELAISEYLEGQFVSELASAQKDLAIAESRLSSAKNMLGYAKMMSDSGYVNELEVEEKQFGVTQADLDVNLIKTQIEVLENFTKEEELATRRGDLNAARAKYEADKERAYADEQRYLRAKEEFDQCVIRAEKAGIVIYPAGKRWEESPDIEEGATVHKDQVLLLMPDLDNMQVKVGIHESIIDRVRQDMPAKITLAGKKLDGKVASVASVARPAGWWTGNVVKYDTVVELPTVTGLKPGMSVEVEVIMAQHTDVLMVPTAAVLETRKGFVCWVQTDEGIERRSLTIGDSSDMFIAVEKGLDEGDQVVLNPLAYVEEAQEEAARTLKPTKRPRKTTPV